MVLTLNLDGLIDEDQPESHTRHVTPRKPIALNFSNANKPQATGLVYWQKHKLATPLIWFLFDSLANQIDPDNPKNTLSVKDVIENTTPEEYAKKLLEQLRNMK